MQIRTRLWLLAVAGLVVAAFFVTFRPLMFSDRAGRSQRPIARLGPLRVYPPQLSLTLGLDLQGGAHLVLQCQKTSILTYQLKALEGELSDTDRTAVRTKVLELLPPEKLGVSRRSVDLVRDQPRITVRTPVAGESTREAAADQNRQDKIIRDTLQEALGKDNVRPVPPPDLIEVKQDQLQSILSIVRSRVDQYGVTEPILQTEPPDRIVVEVPGVRNPEALKLLLQATAMLEIRRIPTRYAGPNHPPAYSPTGDVLGFTDRLGHDLPVEKVMDESEVVVTGADMKSDSRPLIRTGQSIQVTMNFKPEGARRFADYTRRNVGNYFAIMLDNKIISAPVIQEAITGGSGVITGNFTPEEARELSIKLNAGALPVGLEYAEERIVSATLGRDSLVQSLWAGLVGLCAVLVFMVAYYRLPGLLADAALLIYCTLLLGALRAINATLTLPGIFGIILSIGMAVDANVIIFERLKEELRAGKTMKSAIEAGFKRAWTAILDSNLCSIITGIVLYWLGTGPVKGFAITLIIGVSVSLFTAITVTRLFMNLVANTALAHNSALFGVPARELAAAR